MQNEIIDKLKNAGYITVTDDSLGIADKVGVSGGGTGEESGYCLFADDVTSITQAMIDQANSEAPSGKPLAILWVATTYWPDGGEKNSVYIVDTYSGQTHIYLDALNASIFQYRSEEEKEENIIECHCSYGSSAPYEGKIVYFNLSDYSDLYEPLYLDMESPAGTLNIDKNGDYNVFNYASAKVAVPQPQPSGTINIDTNGTYNVAWYAKAKVNVEGGGGGSAEYPEAIVECTDGLLPVMDYNLGNDFTDPENPVFSLEGFISLKDGNDVVSVDFDAIETELQTIHDEWNSSEWPEPIINLSTRTTNQTATIYDIPESSTVLAPLANFSLFDMDDMNYLTRFPLIRWYQTFIEEVEPGQLESGEECSYHMTSSIMDPTGANGKIDDIHKIFEYCSTGEIVTNFGWIIPVTIDDMISLSNQNNPTLPEKLYLILLFNYDNPQPTGTFKICNVSSGISLDNGGTLH